MRTLYLQRYASTNGEHSFIGRKLFDQFRSVSEECLLGHIVLTDEAAARVTDTKLENDIIPEAMLRELAPNLIYLEGGLFQDNSGTWRIPRHIAENLISSGTILIVADAGINEVNENKKHYREASEFLKVLVDYGDDEAQAVYGSDLTSRWKGHTQIICKADEMATADWLKTVYAGVPEIFVNHPVNLISWENIVASGNRDTTSVLYLDTPTDKVYCPFASVAKVGHGYVVFIAAEVSFDLILDLNPNNAKWLINIANLLIERSDENRRRYTSHLRSQHVLFLSHKFIDKPFVEHVAAEIKNRGVRVWLDKEELIPSDSLIAQINRALGRMTHFAIFWSRACVDAPWVEKELNVAATRLINEGLPIFVVRLDDSPVPPILLDIFRIEALGKSPVEIGASLVTAIEQLSKRV